MNKLSVKFFLLVISLVGFQCKNSVNSQDEVKSDSARKIVESSFDKSSDTADQASIKQKNDTVVVISDTTSILIKSMEQVVGLNGKGERIIPECKDWTLDSASIVKMMRSSYPINRHDFMYLYSVLECELTGKVTISDVPYKLVINAGSYFKLFSKDTVYIFGCSSDNCRQFFLKQGGDPKRDLGAY